MKTTVNKMSADLGMENSKIIIDGHKIQESVAIAEKPNFGAGAEGQSAGNVLTLDGISYYVNDTYAINNAMSVRRFGMYAKLAPLLIYNALVKGGVTPNEDGKIIINDFRTGIPLANVSEKSTLINALKPEGKEGFVINGVTVVIVGAPKIFVQGALAPLVKYGRKMPRGFTVIVEIGSKTVEVLTLEDGKIVNEREYSHSLKSGMNKAYRQLKVYLESRFNTEISEAKAAEAFRSKRFIHKSIPHDISEVIDQETSSYARKLVSDLETQFEKAFEDASRILVSGGGAYNEIVVREFKKSFDNIETLDGEHEWINAKGYDLV